MYELYPINLSSLLCGWGVGGTGGVVWNLKAEKASLSRTKMKKREEDFHNDTQVFYFSYHKDGGLWYDIKH